MGSKGGSTTATSTTKPPADVTKAYDQISQQAFSAANAPLQQYSGALLAGFTPAQNQAFQSIQNTQGAANPYYQQANQYVQNSAAPITLPQFSQQALQQYSSPYQQDVISATMAQLGQQNAIDQNSELGKSIAGGAFGGDRSGIAAAQLAKNQGLNNASVLAGLNNQNYSQALGQFNTQQQASLNQQAANAGVNAQAASLSGNLGAQQQQSNLLDQNALLQSGTLQQQQAQQALNIPYQQFQQQQQYPFQTTQFLANTLLGTAGSQGSSTTSQQPQPNGTSAAIGDAIGIAGLFLNTGGRAGYANGGSIIPDASQSYIPLNSPVPVSQELQSSPFAPQPSQQQDGRQSDLLSALSALKKINDTKGWFSNQADADAAAEKAGIKWNQPAQQLIPSNPNTPASVNAQAPGTNEYNSILWNQPASQLPGITARGFADGGTTTAPNFDQVNLGNGVTQGMSSVVAGTPVYSFDPKFAASQGSAVKPPVSAPTTQTQSAGPTPTQTDLLGALSRTQSSGPTGPGGAGYDVSNDITSQLLNSIINPKGKASWDPTGQTWVDYNGDPYTGMASGGRTGYDDGGQVIPLLPPSITNQYGPFAPAQIPATSSLVPDVSQSPVPTQSQPEASAPQLQPNQPPVPQAGTTQSPAFSSAVSPVPTAAGAQNPDIAALGKVDPAAAISAAGFAIGAGKSPYALQNIGEGALTGLEYYGQQKQKAVEAQLKAQELQNEVAKFHASQQEVTKDWAGNPILVDKETGKTTPLSGSTAQGSSSAQSGQQQQAFGFTQNAPTNPIAYKEAQKIDKKLQDAYSRNDSFYDPILSGLDRLEQLAPTAGSSKLAPTLGAAANIASMTGLAPNSVSKYGDDTSEYQSTQADVVNQMRGLNYVPGSRGSNMAINLLQNAKPDISLPVPTKLSRINQLRAQVYDNKLTGELFDRYRNASPQQMVDSNALHLDDALKQQFPLTYTDKNGVVQFNQDNADKLKDAIPDAIANPQKYLNAHQQAPSQQPQQPPGGGQQQQAAPPNPAQLLQDAKAAIAAGAPRDAVLSRLKTMNVDASGL